MKQVAGFTLAEIMIATIVLVVALVSTLGLLNHSLSLPENAGDSTIAMHEAEAKMEEICLDDYLTIRAAYTNGGALLETPFVISGLNGMGAIYAKELAGATDGLMRIKVVVCYQEKNRLVGEDLDLDGILDQGEDTMLTNGELDSPCQLETVVVNKEF